MPNEITAKKMPLSAKVLVTLTGGIGLAISLVAASFVAPAFRKYCLPYVPATSEQIKNILSLLSSHQNNQISRRLLDIGSGDGRIVFATAAKGFISDGVELNRWLVYYSRFIAIQKRMKNTKFYKKDLWKFDISSYDYIVIFGVDQMMSDLEKKIVSEAKISTNVIACRFPLPNFVPKKIVGTGIDTVWLYQFEDTKLLQNKTRTKVSII